MKIQFAGLALLLAMPGVVAGQMRMGASATSYGVSVRTANLNQTAASATLPGDGTLAQAQASNVTLGSYVSAQDVFAVATGDGDDPADAGSSVTLESVSVLNGLITADGVVAIASSSAEGSNGDGSSLANVTVNGVSLGDAVAPNTRVELPGVGYVVLNEQTTTPGGITVNMIHVVLQQSVLGVTRTTGEIVVGSASSSVN
ncbi:MAG TPA: choice-of-anchor P family protein [Gemmatimonadales bacterium]|nr:choice-of-anchor P family protein [Gemmatimonadales bacterium]